MDNQRKPMNPYFILFLVFTVILLGSIPFFMNKKEKPNESEVASERVQEIGTFTFNPLPNGVPVRSSIGLHKGDQMVIEVERDCSGTVLRLAPITELSFEVVGSSPHSISYTDEGGYGEWTFGPTGCARPSNVNELWAQLVVSRKHDGEYMGDAEVLPTTVEYFRSSGATAKSE